jgi:hypothetical protein
MSHKISGWNMSEPVRLGEVLPQVLADIQKRMRENGHSSTRKTAENRVAAGFAVEVVQESETGR